MKDQKHQLSLIAALEEWIRRTDLAEHVPPSLQAVNGYRTRDTDTAVALAVLALAREQGRTTRLALSMRKISKAANVGSLGTIHNALQRLNGWFVVLEEIPQNRTHAYIYSISPSMLAMAEEMVKQQIPHIDSEKNYVLLEGTNVPSLSIYGKCKRDLPLYTHMRHPAFSNKRFTVNGKVSPGPSALSLINYLVEMGGTASRNNIRKALHLSSSSLSRRLSCVTALDLVFATRREVKLNERWAEIVDEFVAAATPSQRREA